MVRKGVYLFTSESVTEGHPDKIADQISDTILDEFISADPYSRVACETVVTTGLVFITGEITSNSHKFDIDEVVRKKIEEIGYDDSSIGFDYKSVGIISSLKKQSPDIAIGVDIGGAGDQGMMFGYAKDETPSFMPLTIDLAHKLTRELARARKSKELPFLRPDGKSQVTVEYQDGVPVRVRNVVVAAQHSEEISQEDLRNIIIEKVVKKVIPSKYIDEDTEYFINATGKFVIGGPQGDAGLTGRKVIADTYGGWARHGGGAFSGKDPTKVDRSAAYMMRYIAKNIVASGIAKECEIQVAYVIGVSQPVSLVVNTYGTSKVHEEEIERAIWKNFDLTPKGIIEYLNLRRPIYQKTAVYGHFGRDPEKEPEFTWERLDKVDVFKSLL
ncbi:MAG: methionine adenosyltransferase [Spirochaetia bacterium]|nr:methionine adenosyltransferase [Spirochaetota bacterium]MDW8113126.1 methionine adenosyltransferase [Spirochaetia bacterium]